MAGWFWPGAWTLDLAVLGLAVLLDALLPEPPNAMHPVVWMGKLTAAFDRRAPHDQRRRALLAGAGIAVLLPVLFAAAAGWAGWGLREWSAAAYVIGGAVLLKSTFAVRGLTQAALVVARPLAEGRVDAAREGLPSLVGRDPAVLSETLVAAAAVESVAENASDSFAAPWLAFAVLGLPGAFAYRAVNTLDSMIGYRGRYEYLGKASARLDDAINWLPSRVTAMLVLAAGALVGLSPRRGWTTLRRDHASTASPNAGWPMSAMAGLLGVALEKPGHYRLGAAFRDPAAGDIRRAVRVCYGVAALALPLAGGVVAARHALL